MNTIHFECSTCTIRADSLEAIRRHPPDHPILACIEDGRSRTTLALSRYHDTLRCQKCGQGLLTLRQVVSHGRCGRKEHVAWPKDLTLIPSPLQDAMRRRDGRFHVGLYAALLATIGRDTGWEAAAVEPYFTVLRKLSGRGRTHGILRAAVSMRVSVKRDKAFTPPRRFPHHSPAGIAEAIRAEHNRWIWECLQDPYWRRGCPGPDHTLPAHECLIEAALCGKLNIFHIRVRDMITKSARTSIRRRRFGAGVFYFNTDGSDTIDGTQYPPDSDAHDSTVIEALTAVLGADRLERIGLRGATDTVIAPVVEAHEILAPERVSSEAETSGSDRGAKGLDGVKAHYVQHAGDAHAPELAWDAFQETDPVAPSPRRKRRGKPARARGEYDVLVSWLNHHNPTWRALLRAEYRVWQREARSTDIERAQALRTSPMSLAMMRASIRQHVVETATTLDRTVNADKLLSPLQLVPLRQEPATPDQIMQIIRWVLWKADRPA